MSKEEEDIGERYIDNIPLEAGRRQQGWVTWCVNCEHVKETYKEAAHE